MTQDVVEALLDEGSWAAPGHGTVEGRPVCVYAGSPAAAVVELAARVGCPVVAVLGAAVDDPAGGLPGVASTAAALAAHARASGVVPQAAVVLGECTGSAALVAGLCDVVVVVEGAGSVSLPTAAEIEVLTGAEAVALPTDLASYVADDEDDAWAWVREWLSHLPSNNLDEGPAYDDEPAGPAYEPSEESYDVHDVVASLLDGSELLEVSASPDSSAVVGLGRVEGRSVGLVATQPSAQAGALDAAACRKVTRLVRFCDAFHLPVLTVVDCPGAVPGDETLRGVAGVLHAYADATVPLVTVITGRAWRPAAQALGSRSVGADIVLAWPGASVDVAAPAAVVDARHGEEIDAADDPVAKRAELLAAYDAGPGDANAVVSPGDTRDQVARALRLLRTKRVVQAPKKHGTVAR